MRRSTARIAWRNLGRNKRRTMLAVGAIALGQFTLVFINGIMEGSYADMLQTVTGPLVGHVQVHHSEWREERAIDLYIDNLEQVEEEIAALPGVQSVSPRIYTGALAATGEKTDEPADAEPAMIIGVDVAAETGKGGVLEGLPPEKQPGGRAVVVGQVLANRLGLEAGKTVAIIGQDADGFPVSDLFDIRAIVDSKVDIVKRLGVVMTMEDAGTFLAMPDQAHEIVVQGEDLRQADALSAAVAGVPGLSDAEVLTWREAMPEIARIIDMKGWFDFILLLIVFVAAAAGIANTAMMSTFERIHEFGMLLAMGTRPGRIIRLVLIESVIIGLVAVLIGSVFGTALVLVTGQTGINYAALGGEEGAEIAYAGVNFSYIIYPKFDIRHVIYGILAVTITSTLASLWPASVAARLEPTEAMRS